MAERRMITIDGNQATTSVAHRTNEVIAIYPITPSSVMGEFADEWSAKGQRNIWGTVPQVVEMQSEGGAAAAVHGALQAGALTTTFTASQGLLLMIPSMYKIAGELTSYCMHVSARTLATHALSIFGDHSDVMACRQTGFALLSSGSVQEAHDFACIGQAATLASRIPFLHFFEGFRISHEVATIEELSDDDLRQMMSDELVAAHRDRAMTPDRPFIRGTAQNPNEFFQAREACNPFYEKCVGIVAETMEQFAEVTGRHYHLFDYVGHPEAERVIVLMGSGADAAKEAIDWMTGKGERVGMIRVRLYRPFSIEHFVAALPKTTRTLAILDRTKEPGAVGDPLYEDVITALREAHDGGLTSWDQEHCPHVVGGRYGLSSKEFNPAMVKAVFDELGNETPKNHFTVGIVDDVSHTSLPVDETFETEADDVVRAVFFGLGADGTVGANKNSIKIIGEETDNYAQGYFVYDSKKAGAITISHLRFGPRPIHSTYLIKRANFVGCHQFLFLEKYDVLDVAAQGGVFLLNAPFGPDEVWDHLPREVQEQLIEKKLKFYVIDAYKVAREAQMGSRINTIMQTCFFAISGVLPREEAIAQIKKAIEKTYAKKGPEIVERNFAAVDTTLANLHEVEVPNKVTATEGRPPIVSVEAPDFVRNVTAVIMENRGMTLPVSAFPVDGTWPSGTTKWEKRNVAQDIPVWAADVCIQCGKCSLVCPHAAIRMKAYDPALLEGAPETFKSIDYRAADFRGMKFTIQVAPEDCTGCGLCVSICPGKDKENPERRALAMQPQMPLRAQERENYAFFLGLPYLDREKVKRDTVKGSQFLEPLFEYSGCCPACGETPYVKLLSQLFGDRALISNATGCSSIYGGNLPTTPYTIDADGRGPTWNNSLFEDSAEFGFGFRLAVDKHAEQAVELLQQLAVQVGNDLAQEIISADQSSEAGIAAQRKRVAALREKLSGNGSVEAARLLRLVDYLVKKSVWLLGGDGWAYDIGYGGLDHVLALGRNVNVLVLDTEVYSNTGGQASKATPLGAVAKFAAAGKAAPKKDLGLMAMSYGNVYVAQVAMGARDGQTVKAFVEADSYPGPSMIIAYSHCIAHGYDLINGPTQQKLAVDAGLWPLYRYDPRRAEKGEPPLKLDSGDPKIPVGDYMRNEARFRMIEKMNPQRYQMLLGMAQQTQRKRWAMYKHLAALTLPAGNGGK
ncbi:MAG: pyruvate:ferredoxin (flavodoxin) oxidoreductase [Candidatus Eisenbacteria sp.]|nr:pyruvate:ferredoxin (flavodoxin) oxidoreductase [Candidatus Eisenbacteria bacterium]